MSERIVTPTFRVAYPAVFSARENLSGILKYSLVMLFKKEGDGIDPIKALIEEAIQDKYGLRTQKSTNIPNDLDSPIRDGDEKDYAGYAGHWAITASNYENYKPEVIDALGKKITTSEEFYAGCYAKATIKAFFYDRVGKGISISLHNIMKVNDGEPLIRTSIYTDFGIEETKESSTDSTEEKPDTLYDLG